MLLHMEKAPKPLPSLKKVFPELPKSQNILITYKTDAFPALLNTLSSHSNTSLHYFSADIRLLLKPKETM